MSKDSVRPLATVSFWQRLSRSKSQIIIVTGPKGSGKSSFCVEMALLARAYGLDVAGVISLPRFDGSTKAAIDLMRLRTSSTRRLAFRRDGRPPGNTLHTTSWDFDESTIEWGNSSLQDAIPCDLLVVDEVGPLEMERGAGLLAGLDALDSRNYLLALVVVRPDLVPKALKRWPDAGVLDVSRDMLGERR